MSFAATIPHTIAFLASLCDICLAAAVVGCVLTLLEAGFVLGFRGARRDHRPGFAPQPAVTILKPLHGAEPGLHDRLSAFWRQDYGGPVQIVCGAQDHASAAAATARELKRDFPDCTIELTVDARSHGANGKVSNLINMLPRARHGILVLSDSDIVVGPDYLRTIAELLSAPRVGAVTCLYHGIPDEGPWSHLSALAINTHFLPQAVTATVLKLAKPCCGATIALRRSTLERIGGFSVFADVLADDYAIGLAVRATGYNVVTAPTLVGHRCFEQSLRQLLLHQIRAARTIKSIDPIGYAGTILTHPWPLALLGMLSGSTAAVLVALAALASRVTLCHCVERRFGLQRQNYWLIPLQDVIAFGVYIASYCGATVHWRGADYRVTSDGTLIEDKT